MILAYVDTVYIEHANVFLIGIGMYSCLEWVDVGVLVAPYWKSIGSLLAVYWHAYCLSKRHANYT